MDLVNNLLQPNAPLKIITVPRAEVDGAIYLSDEEMEEMHQEEEVEFTENYSYARVYQEREAATYMAAARRMANEANMHSVSIKRFFTSYL